MNLNKWFGDKIIRRQIQTWSILVGFVTIPLIYAIISNGLEAKIKQLLEAQVAVTGLGIIGLIGGSFVVMDFKQRAVENTREEDKKIDKSYIDLHNLKNEINPEDIPVAIKYIDTCNVKGQKTENDTLTTQFTTKYTNRVTKAQIKGKTNRVKG